MRLVMLAFSLAGLAYAQDVALGEQVRPAAASTARVVPSSVPDVEPADLTGMLAAQNQVRARLGLEPLAWSADLTDAARSTVRTAGEGACTMASTGRAVRGQDVSLYWASALRRLGGVDALQDISPGYVVSRWREGRAAYDAAGGKCPDGSTQCAAYARIGSSNNRAVGCAKLVCPSQAQIWACLYRE